MIKGIKSTLLVLAFSTSWACSLTAQESPRRKVIIFAYEGAKLEASTDSPFSRFQGIVREKLQRMREQLKTYYPGGISLDSLDLYYIQSDPPNGGEAQLEYWKKTRSLELLSGVMFTESNGQSLVKNRVYLGDLQGNLPERSLPLDLRISPEEFETTRDTISLITLYALAMDAKRSGESRAVIAHLLTEALNVANDLNVNTKEPKLMGLKELRAAIEQSLRQLK